MIKQSKIKNYSNLLMFLKRKKLGKSGLISSLLIEICLSSKTPMGFNQIKQDIVKFKGIFPSEDFASYCDWRHAMIKNGILICMASYQEMKDDDANYKASMFKIGPAVKKYIEGALAEQMSIYERLDKKADLIDMQNKLDTKANVIDMQNHLDTKASKEKVDILENEVAALNYKVEQMIELLLEAMPPDTHVRKEIARKLYGNKKECVAALKAEKKTRKINLL